MVLGRGHNHFSFVERKGVEKKNSIERWKTERQEGRSIKGVTSLRAVEVVVLTGVLNPVVDGFGRGFDLALDGHVRAEGRTNQLIGDLDHRVDCGEIEKKVNECRF